MTPDLAPLLGAAREGIAAIENLGQLLGSSRVGARKIGGALPSVREACEELLICLSRLEAGLEVTLSASAFAAAAAVIAEATETVTTLTAEIAAAGVRLTTGVRIALERHAKAAGAKLGTAWALLDLFGAPATRGAVAVDFAEIFREQWSVAPVGLSLGVQLDLAPDGGIHAEPRLVGAMVELALALVAAGTAAPVVRIESSRRVDGRLAVRIDAAPGGVATSNAPHRAAVPSLADALIEAGRRLGAEITVGTAAADVTLAIGTGGDELRPIGR